MNHSAQNQGPSRGAHWEEPIYAKGRQLNRYPFEAVISFVYSRLGGVPDRSRCRILEVGCGAGNNVWFLAREGFCASGIDGSASAIDYARERLTAEGLSADLRCGDFTALPWEDDSFDAVIDRAAISHNRRSDIEATLDEVARVLQPGGLFLSQFFSWEDGGRPLGRDLGDGSYDEFSGGYFKEVGVTFFANAALVDSLFGSRFEIVAKEHVTFERETEEKRAAFWNLTCKRAR